MVNGGVVRYELVREIFNLCSGNQMRDVFVSEIETNDTDEYITRFLTGGSVKYEKNTEAASVIYDIEIDGLKQRLSFTEA